jgi:proteasome accessory factor C
VTPSRTAVRLRRMLRVVPYAVRHPGTKLSELARLFELPEAELVQDLNLLFVTGVPPYGPGDLVDVEIEDGRVWISMADHLSRPVRLTRDEALSLALRGTAVAGTPGLAESEALASALAKIEAGLGEQALGGLAGRVERADEAGTASGPLAVARRAVQKRERLRVEYYSATRDEVGERLIEPEQIFAALGHWYVVAWDVDADGERMFRADRLRSATPTGDRFEPRGLAGAGRPMYSRSEDDVEVVLRLAPTARWVAEYYEIESTRELDDGGLEVTMPTKDLAWLAKLMLRLGADGEVVRPPELADLARSLAASTLAWYRPR